MFASETIFQIAFTINSGNFISNNLHSVQHPSRSCIDWMLSLTIYRQVSLIRLHLPFRTLQLVDYKLLLS